MTETTSVATVPQVDLNRYLGTWYEICRLPMRYEDATASDITATYSLNSDGTVLVDNRCIDEDGQPTQSIGQASAIDETNSKLTVTFLPPLLRWIPFTKGDYWIMKLDPDYQISLVGDPDRKFLWLLARDPHLSEVQKAEYLDFARSQGYDLTHLITPKQTGRKVSDTMLASAA